MKTGIFRRLRSAFRREVEKVPVTEIRMPEAKNRQREWSKNKRLYRVKSACGGFPRLVGCRFGKKIYYRGPTHFSCGPGFPKLK